MKFRDIETPEKQRVWGYAHHRESEDGEWWICTSVVVYGYRVIVMQKDSVCLDIELCGGADTAQIKLLYAMVQTYLEQKPEGMSMGERVRRLPRPAVKPFYNDFEWVKWMAANVDMENIVINEGITSGSLSGSRMENFKRIYEKDVQR